MLESTSTSVTEQELQLLNIKVSSPFCPFPVQRQLCNVRSGSVTFGQGHGHRKEVQSTNVMIMVLFPHDLAH